ncbi:MAG: sialidase family protein, partial [Armatimonadota bacterium]
DWGGHISASYRVYVRRKEPDSEKWESFDASLPPLAMIAGFGAGIVLPNDTILKPVYGLSALDDPATRAWVLRSTDKGKTWRLVTMAYDGVHGFNEASILRLPDGRILGMIRTEGGKQMAPRRDRGFLYQVFSDDDGLTWTPAEKTDIWGYPPTLLLLKSGDVLCSYGYRRPPYGIRACFSRDGGRTWDVEREVILRDDALPEGPLAGKGGVGDLGYPRSVELSDGTIFTVYYITLGDGVTHIQATKWSPDYIGPADLPRGGDAVPRPDPGLPAEHVVGEVGARRLVYGLMQSFIPTERKIRIIAVRVSEQSAREGLKHTYGLYVAIRKPNEQTWWTPFLGRSRVLRPDEVRIGGWNAFVFDEPVEVTPGETYVLTVYNLDYVGGGATRLKEGLSGDHSWFINAGPGKVGDYPNGGMGGNVEEDLAFKVYAEEGALPGQ